MLADAKQVLDTLAEVTSQVADFVRAVSSADAAPAPAAATDDADAAARSDGAEAARADAPGDRHSATDAQQNVAHAQQSAAAEEKVGAEEEDALAFPGGELRPPKSLFGPGREMMCAACPVDFNP